MKRIGLIPVWVFLAVAALAQDTLHVEWKPLASGFQHATAIDISRSGQIYVLETIRNRLVRLNPEGFRTDSLGSRGSGNTGFDNPAALDATNDLRLYIADHFNGRVQVFDRHLSYLSTMRVTDRAGRNVEYRPVLVAENAFGEVFVWDEVRGGLLKFDANGVFARNFPETIREIAGTPTALVMAGDEIWLADAARGVIHRVNRFGSYTGFLGGYGKILSVSSDGNNVLILFENKCLVRSLSDRSELILMVPVGARLASISGNRIAVVVNDRIVMSGW